VGSVSAGGSIAGGVDWVAIGTRPDIVEDTIRECEELGIGNVWMHRGPGRCSVSEKAAAYGRQHGDRRRLPLHVRAYR
jgi:hypothetical protein